MAATDRMGMTSGGSYGMPWLIGEQAAASDGASDRARGLLLRRGANPCGRDGSGGEDGEQQAGAAERSMPKRGGLGGPGGVHRFQEC